MTFVIRDDNKAFRLNPNAIYDVLFDEQLHAYFVTMDELRISPYFEVFEPNETREDFTDEEYEDITSTAEYYAIKWLCNFLEQLNDNPAVMHCVCYKEIFTYPVRRTAF